MLALSGRVQMCVSEAVLAEYEDVIRRPHIERDAAVIEETHKAIRRLLDTSNPQCTPAHVATLTIICSSTAPKLLRRLLW
jgi:gentisate 1,2-dioxygenase